MSVKKLASKIIVRLLSLALALTGVPVSVQADHQRATEAESKMAAGEDLSERGQFEEAIGRWREAERAFEGAKDVGGEIRALLRQAGGCQSLGQHRLALRTLKAAEQLAKDSKSSRCEAEVKAARGAIAIFAREADLRSRITTCRIYSTGVGLIVNATRHAQATIYWGHPFVDFHEKKVSLQDYGLHLAVSINAL